MDLKQFCIENGISMDKLGDIGEISDGFHTFNSLYHQRLILFTALVNVFSDLSWKSRLHHTGELPFGGGWFIVGVDTPKGQYTYHYENKYWDLFHCKEVEKAPEWDGHTDKDVERLLDLAPKQEERGVSKWATDEVKLAIELEGDCGYGVACYESALRAYQVLYQDGHSDFSIQLTKNILNRLIDGKCLTPIEDTPDIWNVVHCSELYKGYQCKRMSSFFKNVTKDGAILYDDVARVQCIEIGSNITFTDGKAIGIINELFPITMPYYPSTKKFTIFCEEFLVDPKNGDYDTVGYLYVITPDGDKVELNRYFKDGGDSMIPIEKTEFEERKANRIDKK